MAVGGNRRRRRRRPNGTKREAPDARPRLIFTAFYARQIHRTPDAFHKRAISASDRVVCVRCIAGFAGLRCDRSDNSTAISGANPNGRISAAAAAATTPIIVASVGFALLLLVVLLLLALYLPRSRRPPPPRDPTRIEVNPNDVFFSIADYTELSPPERKRELPAAVKRNSAQFYFLSPNGGDEDKLMDDSDDEQETGATDAERH
uniref:Uncharacterized protein n=1 Tax=Plectus sambesii TaxID=2011161 RepID=A0A914VTM7_9BILA